MYLKDTIGDSKELLEKYCREGLGLENPNVRVKRIKVQSLIRWNGYKLHISGKSNQQLIVRNAVPMCLSQQWTTYVKKLEKTVTDGFMDENVTSQSNLDLYDILVKKHTDTIYKKRPNTVGQKLVNGRDKFINLSEQEQANVLMQILQLSQLANLGADLSLIGGAKKTGMLLISKNVSDAEEFVLINQSPAGLYETEIDLKTI